MVTAERVYIDAFTVTPNYPARKTTDGYLALGGLSVTCNAGHEQSNSFTPSRGKPPGRGRRGSLRGRRRRRPTSPRAFWLEKAGILPPQRLSARLRSPLPLARSRCGWREAKRLLACSHRRCFPSLGFEPPAFTNRLGAGA